MWHSGERKISVPLRLVSDLGWQFNKSFAKPFAPQLSSLLPQSGSISLQRLSDFVIEGAMGELDETLYTNEMMN